MSVIHVIAIPLRIGGLHILTYKWPMYCVSARKLFVIVPICNSTALPVIYHANIQSIHCKIQCGMYYLRAAFAQPSWVVIKEGNNYTVISQWECDDGYLYVHFRGPGNCQRSR